MHHSALRSLAVLAECGRTWVHVLAPITSTTPFPRDPVPSSELDSHAAPQAPAHTHK